MGVTATFENVDVVCDAALVGVRGESNATVASGMRAGRANDGTREVDGYATDWVLDSGNAQGTVADNVQVSRMGVTEAISSSLHEVVAVATIIGAGSVTVGDGGWWLNEGMCLEAGDAERNKLCCCKQISSTAAFERLRK
jgi:hypothetical protein